MAFKIWIEMHGSNRIVQWASNLPVRSQQQAMAAFGLWGSEMVMAGTRLSPKDKLRGIDPRRRPVGKMFAAQWRYNAKAIGRSDAELNVGNVDDRMRFIIHDTKPRAIPHDPLSQLAKGYPMRFWSGGTWRTAWKILGGVATHGTRGQPVHKWIIRDFALTNRLRYLASRIK